MASPRHPTTMENLPAEVLSEIFIRLLAKQVAQMRCVCKPWKALLSEPSFVKSHLNHSLHKKEEILLFFRRGFSFDGNPLTVRPSCSPNLELIDSIKLPVNLQSKNGEDHGSIIGSVNGLICFYYVSYYAHFCDYVVYIWNPSLSALLTLPLCSLPAGDSTNFHFRFGYDPKTDDYKVVKLTTLSGHCVTVSQAEVYSMRKGSWDLISQRCPSPITMIRHDDDVCVDDHVHWLCFTDFTFRSLTMVAFDLAAETFREIPLPDSIPHHHGYRFNEFGVLGGKLCVMSSVKGGKCEVWVMDEYGVAESWVKHHALSQFSGEITPYIFTLHHEFLFQVDENDNCFGLYDPVAAKTKTFRVMGEHLGIPKVVEYVDSLVWVGTAEPHI